MIKKILFVVLFLSYSVFSFSVKIHTNSGIIKTKIFMIPDCSGNAKAYIYNVGGTTHIVFKSGVTKKTYSKINKILKQKGLVRVLIVKCAKNKENYEYEGTGVPA